MCVHVCVCVCAPSRTLGQVSCLLLFTFSDGVRITRSLTATITSSELDSLGPSSAYRGGRGSGRRVTRAGHHDVVPGEKPSRSVVPLTSPDIT